MLKQIRKLKQILCRCLVKGVMLERCFFRWSFSLVIVPAVGVLVPAMWPLVGFAWLITLAWHVDAELVEEAKVSDVEPVSSEQDAGACSQCPVRLLQVNEAPDGGQDLLQLNEAGLQYLESQRSPLFLVPTLGVYRGGKSLLLNRLMQRQAPYAHSFGIGHGQQTFTRGIEICAEALPDHAGTLIWMDTEGLFSSEDARSAYGPKIFSLALLFSSVVLLNNLKVLNQQFFVFFEDQQQVARILREGLRAEGMRSDLLLPENLSILWVLQQPIDFAGSAESSRSQLDSFLSIQDKARERIKDAFKHLIHEVPSATHDARQWPKLDQVADEELLPEYISSTQELREKLLVELQTARPLQSASVVAQLRMYVDLVQKDHFSISLAKEAFEDSHVAQLCDSFGQMAQDFAAGLPSVNLSLAMNMSEHSIQEQREVIVKDFHLGDAFLRRLQQCLDRKRLELEAINQEMVLAEWQNDVHKVAESGRCFILSKLATSELPRYRRKYGPVFSKAVEAKARDFALQVQRSRVAGCVLLRHFAVPLAPWFAWPIMALYIRQGSLSGILTLAVHGVVLAGIYSIVQLFGRLPVYVDLDYQVLRENPKLLEFVMRYPQIPWEFLSWACMVLGWIRVAWILGSQILRPAETRTIGQLSNLELKVNTLLERSEADVKEKILTAALEAALHIDSNDPAAAALALVKGLMVVSQVGTSDTHFAYLFEAHHRSLARSTVKNFQFPEKDPKRCAASCKKDSGKLLRLSTSQEWDELIPAMVETLGKLGGKEVKDGMVTGSPRPLKRLFEDDEDEVEESQSCCGCCCRICVVLILVLLGFVGAAWLLEFSSRAGLLPTAELPNSKDPTSWAWQIHEKWLELAEWFVAERQAQTPPQTLKTFFQHFLRLPTGFRTERLLGWLRAPEQGWYHFAVEKKSTFRPLIDLFDVYCTR